MEVRRMGGEGRWKRDKGGGEEDGRGGGRGIKVEVRMMRGEVEEG